MYSLLLSVIYLAFISLGLPDSLLGAAWPTIYAEMNVPLSYMGFVSMIISIGTILSSLMCDRVVVKFSTRTVTTVSILLTAIALFGFSISTKFYQLCLWGIPYGLGAGAIDAALNNYVALHYSSRHMSWLHCFWGVGTIVSPYVMSYALTHSAWGDGYRIISFIQLGIALILLISFPLWKQNSRKADEEIKIEPIGIKGAIKIKGVMSVLLGFMAYCGAESTSMLWASSYFEGVFNISKEDAAALGSLFFIGMTVGRFISGFITEKLTDTKMIRLGTAVAGAGIILITVPIKPIAIAGFVIIGLGCAPIYPCIIHSTPIRFGKERSQSIIGIQMASAYLGSTLMPPLFGLIANHISIRIMPLYLGLFMSLMIIMLTRADKYTAEK
ncbi:MAG: MFS transporter [Clostridia bacterium]|nr:MFS transporter [Clostridia bacterium]